MAALQEQLLLQQRQHQGAAAAQQPRGGQADASCQAGSSLAHAACETSGFDGTAQSAAAGAAVVAADAVAAAGAAAAALAAAAGGAGGSAQDSWHAELQLSLMTAEVELEMARHEVLDLQDELQHCQAVMAQQQQAMQAMQPSVAAGAAAAGHEELAACMVQLRACLEQLQRSEAQRQAAQLECASLRQQLALQPPVVEQPCLEEVRRVIQLLEELSLGGQQQQQMQMQPGQQQQDEEQPQQPQQEQGHGKGLEQAPQRTRSSHGQEQECLPAPLELEQSNSHAAPSRALTAPPTPQHAPAAGAPWSPAGLQEPTQPQAALVAELHVRLQRLSRDLSVRLSQPCPPRNSNDAASPGQQPACSDGEAGVAPATDGAQGAASTELHMHLAGADAAPPQCLKLLEAGAYASAAAAGSSPPWALLEARLADLQHQVERQQGRLDGLLTEGGAAAAEAAPSPSAPAAPAPAAAVQLLQQEWVLLQQQAAHHQAMLHNMQQHAQQVWCLG